MGATYEVQVVGLEELCEHIFPKEIADASLCVLVPAFLFDWVCPE